MAINCLGFYMLEHIEPLCNAGLSLVAIPPKSGKPTKAPRSVGWNHPRSANNPKGYSTLGIEPEPPKIAPRKPQQGEHLPGRRDPIQEFNQAYRLADVLVRNGYNQSGLDRFIRPCSESKAPGAVIMRNCTDGIERIYSHGGDVLNDSFAHDAFDCMRLLEHGGLW